MGAPLMTRTKLQFLKHNQTPYGLLADHQREWTRDAVQDPNIPTQWYCERGWVTLAINHGIPLNRYVYRVDPDYIPEDQCNPDWIPPDCTAIPVKPSADGMYYAFKTPVCPIPQSIVMAQNLIGFRHILDENGEVYDITCRQKDSRPPRWIIVHNSNPITKTVHPPSGGGL
jgi:hypothetical protein